MRKGVKDIEMCEAQIDHKSEYDVKKVQNAYCENFKLLKQQEKQAIEKVKIVTIVLKKTLPSQKEIVISVEKQLEKCGEDCEELVRAKQSLESIEWIEQEVNKLKEKVKHINLNPKCKPSDIFVRCHEPVKFLSDPICDVSYVPHIPSCTVSNPVVVDDIVRLEMTCTLKDIFDAPIVNQTNNLKLCCDKTAFLQNTHIQESQSRGQYQISYNPKRKELHSLSVYCGQTKVNIDEIKVHFRDYNNITQEITSFDKYGPTNKE